MEIGFNWYLKHHHDNYYSIVEPYRINGRNRHRKVLYLGKLKPEHAQKIESMLTAIKSQDAVVIRIEDILFENQWRYLDIALLEHLWDEWNLSSVFSQSKKDISTANVAKILASYRCLDPGSYLYATEWFKETAWSMMLEIDEDKFNDSRIYRELTEIEDKKEDIERHIYNNLKNKDEESLYMVYYDLTDSYFEGRKCELAAPGRTKSNGFKTKKIVLSLVVNAEGYPFSWEVLKGDTVEVSTLKNKVDSCKKQFEISENTEVTWVFDRGIVSEGNLLHTEENKQKYITALDKNQIPKVPGIDLNWFKEFTVDNVDSEAKKLDRFGFEKYDESLYYREMGDAKVNDKDYSRRYILGFNPNLFKKERENRKEQIRKGFECLDEENSELSKAKGDRGEESTKKRIDEKLKNLGVKRHIKYDLKKIDVKTDKGGVVKSFRIEHSENEKVIKKAEKLDGVCTFITNHLKKEQENKPENKKFDPVRIIKAYRDKNKVEEAFKEVKSFIKFQPSNVRTDKHVKAHYTICVLSYLLDLTVTKKLREYKIDEISSVRKVYQILKRGKIGEIKLKGTRSAPKKMITLQPIEKKILNIFGCEHLVEKKHLKSRGID